MGAYSFPLFIPSIPPKKNAPYGRSAKKLTPSLSSLRLHQGLSLCWSCRLNVFPSPQDVCILPAQGIRPLVAASSRPSRTPCCAALILRIVPPFAVPLLQRSRGGLSQKKSTFVVLPKMGSVFHKKCPENGYEPSATYPHTGQGARGRLPA